jgi:hypothetical protein
MNFFFKLKSKEYDFNLTIPKFTNSGEMLSKVHLYSLGIDSNNLWKYKKKISNDEMFYYINKDYETCDDFYYIANDNICKSLFENGNSEIKQIKSYLDTTPPFRSNTQIIKKNKGFSSYQADYPISMIEKKGSIVSPLNTLLNVNAEINKIFFVNLYFQSIKKKFRYYLIDHEKKKVVFSDFIMTNTINEINIDKVFIKKNIFFVTKEFIGIPIYFSDQDGHLSLEHTHPPHEYIFGKNKFKIITNYKREFNEIIDQENL